LSKYEYCTCGWVSKPYPFNAIIGTLGGIINCPECADANRNPTIECCYGNCGFITRKSIDEVLDNPRPIENYYILVTRYYPRRLRLEGVKFSESPFEVWDRGFAPTAELLKAYKSGEIDWDEYERRFRVNHSPSFIKSVMKDYIKKANGRNIVLVCHEKNSEYPKCHTWLLLKIFGEVK